MWDKGFVYGRSQKCSAHASHPPVLFQMSPLPPLPSPPPPSPNPEHLIIAEMSWACQDCSHSKTWLYYQFSLPQLYIFTHTDWENVLFELGSEKDNQDKNTRIIVFPFFTHQASSGGNGDPSAWWQNLPHGSDHTAEKEEERGRAEFSTVVGRDPCPRHCLQRGLWWMLSGILLPLLPGQSVLACHWTGRVLQEGTAVWSDYWFWWVYIHPSVKSCTLKIHGDSTNTSDAMYSASFSSSKYEYFCISLQTRLALPVHSCPSMMIDTKKYFQRVVICFGLEWSFWQGGFFRLLSEQVTVLAWCL